MTYAKYQGMGKTTAQVEHRDLCFRTTRGDFRRVPGSGGDVRRYKNVQDAGNAAEACGGTLDFVILGPRLCSIPDAVVVLLKGDWCIVRLRWDRCRNKTKKIFYLLGVGVLFDCGLCYCRCMFGLRIERGSRILLALQSNSRDIQGLFLLLLGGSAGFVLVFGGSWFD